jgi:putative SOS response-associated peptidase YedK
VVKTFNEGKEITPKKTEQHRIAPDDGMPLAIAVIWERWGDMLETFAMVTVPANSLIGTITDRMPAILAPEDWAAWLGETAAGIDALKVMLHPFEGDWTMQPETPRPKKSAHQPDQPPLF